MMNKNEEKKGKRSKGQKKENKTAKVNKGKDNKVSAAEDISAKVQFPNFSQLNAEERTVFFQALTDARKNVEKKGAPMRQRFGTVHDAYLDYFNKEEKNEDECPEGEEEDDDISSNLGRELPSLNLHAGDPAEEPIKVKPRLTATRSDSPPETPSNVSESSILEECESVIREDTNKILGIYQKKKKKNAIQKKKEETKRREEKNKSESSLDVKTSSSSMKLSNTPRFDALNDQEKEIFFQTLQEAREHIVVKNPNRKEEILPMDSIISRYRDDVEAKSVFTATQDTRNCARGKKNLRVKVTLTSGDKERLLETIPEAPPPPPPPPPPEIPKPPPPEPKPKKEEEEEEPKCPSGAPKDSLQELQSRKVHKSLGLYEDDDLDVAKVIKKEKREADKKFIQQKKKAVKKTTTEEKDTMKKSISEEGAAPHHSESDSIKRKASTTQKPKKQTKEETTIEKDKKPRKSSSEIGKKKEEAEKSKKTPETNKEPEKNPKTPPETKKEEEKPKQVKPKRSLSESTIVSVEETVADKKAKRDEAEIDKLGVKTYRVTSEPDRNPKQTHSIFSEEEEEGKLKKSLKLSPSLVFPEKGKRHEELERRSNISSDIEEDEKERKRSKKRTLETKKKRDEKDKKPKKSTSTTSELEERSKRPKDPEEDRKAKKSPSSISEVEERRKKRPEEEDENSLREDSSISEVKQNLKKQVELKEEDSEEIRKQKEDEEQRKTDNEDSSEQESRKTNSCDSSSEYSKEKDGSEDPSLMSAVERALKTELGITESTETTLKLTEVTNATEEPRKKRKEEAQEPKKKKRDEIEESKKHKREETEEPKKKRQEETEEQKKHRRGETEEPKKKRQEETEEDRRKTKEESEEDTTHRRKKTNFLEEKFSYEDDKDEEKDEEKKSKTEESVTTPKVMIVDDNVIEKIRNLIYYLEAKAGSEGLLAEEYMKLVLDYVDYLSKVLESLVKKKQAEGQSTFLAAQMHLKFDEDKSVKGFIPRSVSASRFGTGQFMEDKDKKKPKEKAAEDILWRGGSDEGILHPSDSDISLDSTEDIKYVPPAPANQRVLTTKIRLLQDLIKKRAEFVPGSTEEFRIVHHEQAQFVPEQRARNVKIVKEADEDGPIEDNKMKFLRALLKFCRCGKKKPEVDGIFENLKGEAVRVDVTEDKRDPANATLNPSTIEVLKASGRKKIINKYYSKE